MTRGTVIIKKGKKFIAIGYSNSDSYMAGEIGQMFVKAFSADSDDKTTQIINDFIDGMDKKMSNDCYESLMSIGEAFYSAKAAAKAGLKDAFFYDYDYVYDIKTNVLKIYYYGELLYTFKKEQVDFLQIIVENDELIEFAFGYDQKTKQLKGNDTAAKEVKHLMKAGYTPAGILKLAKKSAKEIHYSISGFKVPDGYGHKKCYRKDVSFYPSKKSLEFIFDKDDYDGRWYVYLQLPWVRDSFLSNCSSEKAAMNRLIARLDDYWEGLQNGLGLYDLYNGCKEDLMAFYNGCNKITITESEFNDAVNPIVEKFRDGLQQFEKLNFSGYQGKFYPKRALDEIQEWVYRTKYYIFTVLQKK